jgi:site-specific recombinase XerD
VTRADDSPIEEWWTDFARSLRRRGRSERTIALYKRSYLRFFAFTDADDPAAVTRDTVNRWTEDLQAQVNPATVSIYWRNLRPFFAWWAKEEGQPNPFTDADVPGVPEAEVPVLADDDVRALLDACSGRGFTERRDTALILVLYDTGARLGEIVGMGADAWDRRADHLRLDGKTGPRVVAVGPKTGEALARYSRVRAQHTHAAADAFWLAPRGALRDSGVAQVLARRSAQAGIPRVNPHRFRHTWAHRFRAAGGSEGDLLYLAGWKSPQMAFRYGKSAAGERARDAQRKLGLADRL